MCTLGELTNVGFHQQKKGRKQKKLQYTAIELRQKATKTQIRNKLEISHESAKWLRSLLGLVMCTFMDWVAVPRFVHGEAAETPIPMDIIIFPIKNDHLGGAAHSQTHPIEYKLSITSMIYYHIVSHLIGNGSCRISPSEKAISGWITDTLNHRPTRFILYCWVILCNYISYQFRFFSAFWSHIPIRRWFSHEIPIKIGPSKGIVLVLSQELLFGWSRWCEVWGRCNFPDSHVWEMFDSLIISHQIPLYKSH